QNKKLAFIGCGVMGEAIMATLLHGEMVGAGQITGSEPVAERRDDLARRYGIKMTGSNADAVQDSDLIMLTIKPQSLDSIAKDLRGKLKPNQVVVSILAGAPIDRIVHGLDHRSVVRAMPNTPSQIGQGMTVWMATPDVTDDQKVGVAAALSAMGHAVQVDSENEVDMATALSGTGPAYIFLVMESLIDAGVHMGFSRRIAEELVLQTMIGSVLFAKDSGKHPAELRNMVTSPGGTSAAAIYQMEKGSLRTVISRAVWAAYQRTQELGQGQSVQEPPPSVR
ncbi:MAG TPA: pyrroline-5-carboxylate reductase, partial [Thermomicrobiales bacterium]|nr:pyrroline-5-carboxylate reductase [Thermomicrobiales bacterium]